MSLTPETSREREQDLVKVYLNQMSRIPPISLQEERTLARDLEEGVIEQADCTPEAHAALMELKVS